MLYKPETLYLPCLPLHSSLEAKKKRWQPFDTKVETTFSSTHDNRHVVVLRHKCTRMASYLCHGAVLLQLPVEPLRLPGFLRHCPQKQRSCLGPPGTVPGPPPEGSAWPRGTRPQTAPGSDVLGPSGICATGRTSSQARKTVRYMYAVLQHSNVLCEFRCMNSPLKESI